MQAKETMKAMVATGYGTSEKLKLQQVQKPVPGENEILVKVMASSATTADSMMLSGKPLFSRLMIGLRKPKHPIPGTGFAGIVESTGKNAVRFKAGDHVFGETTLGFSTNAEYLAIPEDGVILHKPENLTYTEACTVCDGHLTSYNFLIEISKVKKGQKVLINGASGSLGIAAVQLAKYSGAEVTGVCSTRNTGLVKSLGADHVIDYTKTDFTKNGNTYDLIFDTPGKSSFRKSKKVLARNGMYLSPVLKFSLLLQMIITNITGKKQAKFYATGLRKDAELKVMLAKVTDIISEGKLRTIIDRQYPLENLADAYQYISTGRKKGNISIINQTENL